MSLDGIKRRGFASQSPERRKELARIGGNTAQAMGSSHKFTSSEAKVAGRKGGLARSKPLRKMPGVGGTPGNE